MLWLHKLENIRWISFSLSVMHAPVRKGICPRAISNGGRGQKGILRCSIGKVQLSWRMTFFDYNEKKVAAKWQKGVANFLKKTERKPVVTRHR